MKTFAFTLLLTLQAVFIVRAQSVVSQEEALNQHRQYWKEHKSELKLEKNYVEVSPADVPTKLQQALMTNDLYKNWQDSPLYLDKDTKVYTLYIKKDSTIIMYGFNDRGKAVTYDSYTVHDE